MAKTTRAMEDMLASIRQAIHEESAFQSAGLHAPARESATAREPQDGAPARLAPANDDAGAADFLRPLRPSRPGEDEAWSDDPVTQERPAGLTDSHTLSGHRRIISGVMGGQMEVDEAMERLGAPAPRPASAFADPEFEHETRADTDTGAEDEGGSWWPDSDAFTAATEHMTEAEPEAPAAQQAALAPLISPQTEAAAASAFARLTQEVSGRAPSAEEMEALTREMLKPMLRDWLDANLPDLVERLVREEIARIARGGKG